MCDAIALIPVAVLLPVLALLTPIKDLKHLCRRRQPRRSDVIVKRSEIRPPVGDQSRRGH